MLTGVLGSCYYFRGFIYKLLFLDMGVFICNYFPITVFYQSPCPHSVKKQWIKMNASLSLEGEGFIQAVGEFQGKLRAAVCGLVLWYLLKVAVMRV